MRKSTLTVFILAIVLVLFLTGSITSLRAQSVNEGVIMGQILDPYNTPIANASASAWRMFGGSTAQWTLDGFTKTNDQGQFTLTVDNGMPHRIYFFYDDVTTSGFDVVPAFRDVPTSFEKVTLTIQLLPAASILFEGNLWFVESTTPAESYTFTINDLKPLPTVDDYEYVTKYGTVPLNHNFLNISSQHIIVPLNRRLQMTVDASVSLVSGIMTKTQVIEDIETVNLTQGDLVHLNVEQYVSLWNYQFMQEQLNSTTQLFEEIDEKGFYVVSEKADLAHIESLLELAHTKLSNNEHTKALTNLREAHVNNMVLRERLESIVSNAISSVSILTFFLAITAMSLALLFFERQAIQLTMYPPIFAGLFALFHYTYPGALLTPLQILIEYILISLGIVGLLTYLIPYLLREKIIATFSLSKRNLRRRKTRFILTVVTIIFLVVSFVSLTSFSAGYGFTVKRQMTLSNPLPQGLYIQQPGTENSFVVSFVPLPPSSIELITAKPEIQLLAPKAENRPQLMPPGLLEQDIPVFGVLGFHPSVEAAITNIDNIVVEGRYLQDDDEQTILISKTLAEEMDVEVDSKVRLTYFTITMNVTVVGFFDPDQLQSFRDVNGMGILPFQLIQYEAADTTFTVKTECDPDEVIILPLDFALTLPGIQYSRLDVTIKDSQDISSVAKEIALEQGLSVWYSLGNAIYEAVVGAYSEGKGAIIFIPWVIVILNVIITMLNSIFEYRKEIAILSSVGLNPLDIISLFIAEASIIGVMGGGLGYLLGISNYKFMSLSSLVIEVRPKVSAFWSVAAVLVSVSAVLVGAFIALRSSIVITPSMRRRWKDEKEFIPPRGEDWVFSIPFKLKEEEVDSVFDYLANNFRKHLRDRGIHEGSGNIRYSEDEERESTIKRMYFNYVLGQKSTISSFPFQVVATKDEAEEIYSFEVVCRLGTEQSIKDSVSFVRMSIIEWSANKTQD